MADDTFKVTSVDEDDNVWYVHFADHDVNVAKAEVGSKEAAKTEAVKVYKQFKADQQRLEESEK